jgi:hypothetical protein
MRDSFTTYFVVVSLATSLVDVRVVGVILSQRRAEPLCLVACSHIRAFLIAVLVVVRAISGPYTVSVQQALFACRFGAAQSATRPEVLPAR